MENIGSITANVMDGARLRKAKSSFLGDSRWAFMLPAGNKTEGSGGLTVNCFNLRFGPFALRVITKSEDELQINILRLGEILRHPDYEENLHQDDSVKAEVESLGHSCLQLCGVDYETPEGKNTIKSWKQKTEVPFHPKIRACLGKIWVYAGGGEDIQTDRIYIRDKLTSWVEGKSPSDDPFPEPLSIQTALEPIDIWLPCNMLDEYCCLSDIPGCCLCHLM